LHPMEVICDRPLIDFQPIRISWMIKHATEYKR
jgi:hypothetical protein